MLLSSALFLCSTALFSAYTEKQENDVYGWMHHGILSVSIRVDNVDKLPCRRHPVGKHTVVEIFIQVDPLEKRVALYRNEPFALRELFKDYSLTELVISLAPFAPIPCRLYTNVVVSAREKTEVAVTVSTVDRFRPEGLVVFPIPHPYSDIMLLSLLLCTIL